MSGLTTSECELEIKGIRGESPIRVDTLPVAPGVHLAWALDDLARTLPYAGLVCYDRGGARSHSCRRNWMCDTWANAPR
jgi:hypothetical protein